MKQRSFTEWRFLAYAALAICLCAGLLVAYAAKAEREEWRPVRFLDSGGAHRTPQTREGHRYTERTAPTGEDRPGPFDSAQARGLSYEQRRVLEPVRQTPETMPRPKAGPGGEWEILEPVRYENISIFPVVAKEQQDTAGFLTLDEGLASGEVVVSERGGEYIRRSRGAEAPGRGVVMPTFPEQERPRVQAPQGGATVNTLALVNRSKRPLLLLAGEVVAGGKQDRIIAKDRIVPPGAEPLPLDVFCVDRGRWSAGNEFKAANLMVHPSVREKAVVAKEQSEVWDAVSRGSTSAQASADYSATPPAAAPRLSSGALGRARTEERSESYYKVYQAPHVVATVESFTAEVDRRFREATRGKRVVGVVVAYGAEVAWSDLFASEALFQRYWAKLLRSYAVEAVARPQWRETATMADAQRFLAPLDGREQIETEPGVYRWREISQGRLSQIELESLLGKAFTLHRVKVLRTS